VAKLAVLGLAATTLFSATPHWALAEPSLRQIVVRSDPFAVFQKFATARNRGDLETVMRLANADIRYVAGSACTPQAPCLGAQAFQRAMIAFIDNGVQTTAVGAARVSGTTVDARMLSTSQARAAIGVDRTLFEVTAEVVEGQIVELDVYPDVYDEQTVWWLDHRPSGGPSAPFVDDSRAE
jgi:hypothetical protein